MSYFTKLTDEDLTSYLNTKTHQEMR